MNIPTSLTVLRIILIPIVVILFYLPFSWARFAAAVLFAIASLTDWLDGYLARQLDQTSPMGAFLDPVADKLLVATALVLIVSENTMLFVTLASAVIIGREIVVSALREWMAEFGQRAIVAVSHIAKVKTIVQMVAITILLLVKPEYVQSMPDTFSLWFWFLVGWIGHGLLLLAAGLTLCSMFVYLRTAWPCLTSDQN